MKKDDTKVSTGINALDSHHEIEILNSSISRYFRGGSEPQQLKEQDSTILSALSVYFHGHVKG